MTNKCFLCFQANQQQLIVSRSSSNVSRPSNLNFNNNINNINNNHIHAATINNINNNYSSITSVKVWTATNLRPAAPIKISAALVRDDLRKSTRGPRKFSKHLIFILRAIAVSKSSCSIIIIYIVFWGR